MPRIDTPAKINWTLEVLGRRPDGYHEIASVMAAVSLYDSIELEAANTWRIDVVADAALQADLAANGNIMERAVAEAAAAWKRANGQPDAVAAWPPLGLPAAQLRLIKRIPAAAGLGGGSSDAAATLRLVLNFWRDALPDGARMRSNVALHEPAALIGSDVSFFFAATRTALARGRGERVQALRPFARQWLVLLVPPLALERKTARLYVLLGKEHLSDGARSRQLAARSRERQPLPVEEAEIVNVFNAVADVAFPDLPRFRRALSAAVGAPAHLSGAGPALFALAPDARAARQAAARLRSEGYAVFAVSTPD